MSTDHSGYSTEERMKREELQMDDRDEDVTEVRDENTRQARPIITPAVTAESAERASKPDESLRATDPSERTEAERSNRAQSAAPVGERVPNKGFGTPAATSHDAGEATERWQRIQSEFVDDPRKAVGGAHELVRETVQRIVDAFTHERDELESQWSKGGDVSTEDLRVCLQHYREFFSKLSPTIEGMRH